MSATQTKQNTLLVDTIFDFHGGIFPAENKHQTSDKGIVDAKLPDELIVPVQQHIGAPAKVCVEIGETVFKGQTIAQANGYISANIHAPSSGTVTAIEERDVQHPSGLAGLCIVIACDGQETWTELSPCEDYLSLSKSQLIEKIRASGIAGMGGAGFPSAVKLEGKDNAINTLILNSAECEPYITADDVLIQAHAKEIIMGLGILNYIIGANEILIGIEDNKPQAIESYKHAIDSSDIKNVKLAVVPTKYPSGGEKQLIQLLTGKEVPASGLPSDIGIVCHNTGTVFAIFEAIVLGKPLISRITTLTGNALASPQNYRSLIGTPFRSLLEEAKINWHSLEQLVMGGPMMGFAVHSVDVPVVKTSNCILASSEGELTSPDLEQPCIRCGSCAEVCPAQLLPQQLYWYSKTKELEKTEAYHLNDCIECGACSFVCPSNIPLVQYFRFAKGETRKKNVELEKSELSRERFEARKARLEREAAEKEEKRLEKTKARQLKKEQQAKIQSNKTSHKESNTESADSLEIAFQLAKTQAAKANKQWKEAQKALTVAEKNQNTDEQNIKIKDDELSALKQQVKALEEIAQQAQIAFKNALSKKKAAQADSPEDKLLSISIDPALQEKINSLDKAIESVRESSSAAAQDLKRFKKALLSAKSGQGDTLPLEKEVTLAKEKLDKLKTELRDLLKQHKALISDQSGSKPTPADVSKETNASAQTTSVSTESNIEKDQLKIAMSRIKAETKKLKQQRLSTDEQQSIELDKLIEENQNKLKDIIQKISALQSKPNGDTQEAKS